MNPRRIRASNYRTFEQLDLDLPAGCVAIVGQVVGSGATDSNGAGKSTLVNAIDVALFGPEKGRSFRPALTRGAAGTELMVELTFDHAGELYRVRRSFSARGAGKTTVDLERAGVYVSTAAEDMLNATTPGVHESWESVTLGSAKETQALLESILGFSRPTFRASSFLVQRDASAFTLADPAVRKRILADALGLDRWEHLRAAVRRDLRAAEQETQRIDGRLEGTTREALALEVAGRQATLVEATNGVASASTALTVWEAKLEEAAHAVQAAKENEAARAAMTARVDAAAAALAAKGQLQRDAITAEEQAGVVRLALAELAQVVVTEKAEQFEQDLVAQLEQHRIAVAERNQAVSVYELRSTEKKTIYAQADVAAKKAVELDEKISLIRRGTVAHCPTCEQELGAVARTATISSLRAQAQTAADDRDALREAADAIELATVPDEPVLPADVPTRLAEVREHLDAARQAELERAKLTERLAGFEKTIEVASSSVARAELEAAEKALEELLAESEALTVVDVAPLAAAAVHARSHVQVERDRLQTAERDRAVAEERLAQLTARAEQLERDLAARERLAGEIDLLAILDRAYSPDGIPALILENAAIPQLETEASRLLQLLGGPVSRVELRTDRAKQDGGVRDDVLDIVCVTETGDCVYDDLSGGEGFRVDIALRLALAQLLATRRGAEVKLLVIDEPDGLDASGKQALIEILRDLETRGGLERIYMISHDADLRDSFDQVLEVVKDETGRSRVESAIVEAVAA